MLARSGLSLRFGPPHFARPMVIRRRRLRRERAADPLHCPDVTFKALVRGGELKVDDLGDLTYSELIAFATRIEQLADEREQPVARRRVN
jgi:hypothetical protein